MVGFNTAWMTAFAHASNFVVQVSPAIEFPHKLVTLRCAIIHLENGGLSRFANTGRFHVKYATEIKYGSSWRAARIANRSGQHPSMRCRKGTESGQSNKMISAVCFRCKRRGAPGLTDYEACLHKAACAPLARTQSCDQHFHRYRFRLSV